MRDLTEKEFDDQFSPSGQREFADVRDMDPHLVWTIVDDGGESNTLYAVPGFHLVNRLFYVTSETPWNDNTPQAVYMADDFDD